MPNKYLFVTLCIPEGDVPDHDEAADDIADRLVKAYNDANGHSDKSWNERAMVNGIPGPQFVDVEYLKDIIAVARERRLERLTEGEQWRNNHG